MGTAPLSAAVDAIVAGVERRARVVYAPRQLGPMLALRGILNPLANRLAPRMKDVRASLKLAEEQPQGPGSGAMSPRSQ
jgi:hypothetical protein